MEVPETRQDRGLQADLDRWANEDQTFPQHSTYCQLYHARWTHPYCSCDFSSRLRGYIEMKREQEYKKARDSQSAQEDIKNELKRAFGSKSNTAENCILDDGLEETKQVVAAQMAANASMDPISQLLAERGGRYGDFRDRARISQSMQDVMRTGRNWDKLTPYQKQALQVFADKIARMLNGDPTYDDNWRDIAGYAQLVLDRLIEDAGQIPLPLSGLGMGQVSVKDRVGTRTGN